MTISTHTRVERGYFRAFYERTKEVRRQQAREYIKCRYRRGCALQLLAELREFWANEQRWQKILQQQTADSPVISEAWTTSARAGRVRLSIGSRATRIPSTG